MSTGRTKKQAALVLCTEGTHGSEQPLTRTVPWYIEEFARISGRALLRWEALRP